MKALLRILLVTSAISLLAITYSIRAVHYFQEGRSPWDESCEAKTEEAEWQGEPDLPPDEQRACWTDPNAQQKWELLGQ
jgi:hypothetical protein